ncbi:MAG TPA: hypothetical protein VFW63_10415 [Acidimicrobiales bacterium]|nr:hypothetical protein [Acidimicrobiales bacterium]
MAGARLAALVHSPWPARATWAVLPLLAGPAVGGALGDASRPVQLVASVGLWAGWAVVLVATLVPTTVSLTALRVAAPAAVAAATAALVAEGVDGADVVGVVGAVVACLAALAPETAEAFVDGSSYGDERRLPLRTPVGLLAGPVELAWLAVVAGGATGPLLLAARQWAAGAVALVAGVPAAWWGLRALHTLARRWLVFVPAGVVVHDPLTLLDPVLLRRQDVAALGPAPADSRALDLTAGAPGLALEVRLSGPVELLPLGRGRAPAPLTPASAVLVTPARPGRVLAEARRRRLRVR